ncbi:hypothetical protein BVRB_1g012400 [Beta vulgaris subsp. vulgaris]|nr:hypothetical protein BVRB_1g012400 [Beta vulgaris subsp. vulgaris]
MRVNQADLYEFEVDHNEDTWVVNLEKKECSCYRWTLMGISCWHALACMEKRRLQYQDFIHEAYHVHTYSKTYNPSFRAMPGQNQWPETPYPKPLPPQHKKLPGRPSKHKRIKEVGEDGEARNVERAKKQNHCSRCGGLGHYAVKYRNSAVDKSADPKRKGGRPKSRTTATSGGGVNEVSAAAFDGGARTNDIGTSSQGANNKKGEQKISNNKEERQEKE